MSDAERSLLLHIAGAIKVMVRERDKLFVNDAAKAVQNGKFLEELDQFTELVKREAEADKPPRAMRLRDDEN